MKFSTIATVCFASVASALNIVVTNDDSFITSNIRAVYHALKDAGHNVFMIAPVYQQSGKGGTFVFPVNKTLSKDSDFGAVKAGSPSWGYEDSDNHIWYVDSSPAGSVSFALDYVIPKFFADVPIDLVVSGPNEGNNAGPALYTLSGTLGASYYAVSRGIPSIALSGADNAHSYYKDPESGWEAHKDDSDFYSNIYARKAVELVAALDRTAGDNPRLLPLGVGLNVNFPLAGNIASEGKPCADPKFVNTRMTGGAVILIAAYNETTGVFQTGFKLPDQAPGINVAYNGDLKLPGETAVSYKDTCEIAVSVYSVDYDANAMLDTETRRLFQSVINH